LQNSWGFQKILLKKKSSPNLWKGHSAEEEIGVRYDEIDAILYCIIDKKLSIDDTVQATGIEKNTVEKINKLYNTTEHKRITAAKL